MRNHGMTRRSFLQISAAAAAMTASGALASNPSAALVRRERLPVGLELYSVRDVLAKDTMGTVRAVAKLGYEVVEFFAPYAAWTPDYARDIRKLLDDLGIQCRSTHNGRGGLHGDGLKHAIELNQILGSGTIVMASSGISAKTETQDDWKKVADTLAEAAETLKPLNMRAGYHNHQLEFTDKDGFRPMPFLAANTPIDVTLQFDVGTCMDAGFDPVAWIKANPGRIRSLHLKDWGKGPNRGYRVLFGEGDTPWPQVLDAADSVGGAEYLLIEQEGSRYPSLEAAEKCLANFRKLQSA